MCLERKESPVCGRPLLFRGLPIKKCVVAGATNENEMYKNGTENSIEKHVLRSSDISESTMSGNGIMGMAIRLVSGD